MTGEQQKQAQGRAPGFRYFIPGGSRSEFMTDPEGMIKRAGLEDRFPSRNGVQCAEVLNHPGGRGVSLAFEVVGASAGLADAWSEEPVRLATEGDPTPATLWLCPVGNPGPEYLARPEQIGGHDLVLGDGRCWTAAILRSAEGIIRLPKRLKLGKGGQLVGDVVPRYVALWEQAQEVWNLMVGDAGVPYGKLWPFCCAVLGLNYRIGQPEISVLGLLDSDNLIRIAEAALDVPSMRVLSADAQKKSPVPVC